MGVERKSDKVIFEQKLESKDGLTKLWGPVGKEFRGRDRRPGRALPASSPVKAKYRVVSLPWDHVWPAIQAVRDKRGDKACTCTYLFRLAVLKLQLILF